MSIAVTPKEILDKVSQIADTRLDETIEKLMVTLRHNHCKGKWRVGCDCDFCRFLKGEYAEQHIRIHRLKRRIEHVDIWGAPDWEMTLFDQLQRDMKRNLEKLIEMKEQKKRFTEQTTI